MISAEKATAFFPGKNTDLYQRFGGIYTYHRFGDIGKSFGDITFVLDLVTSGSHLVTFIIDLVTSESHLVT